MKIRVGIVGTGTIAQWMHIPYIKKIDNYELVAACDISSELVKTVGSKYSIPKVYNSHERMLNKEKLDAIIVCAPDEHHENVCVDAFESGCNVLVEKPLSLSIKSAERIIKSSEKASRKLMVAYMKRFDPGFEKGSEIMKKMDDVFFIRAHDFSNTVFSNSMNCITSVVRNGTTHVECSLEQQKDREEKINKLLYEELGNKTLEKACAWRNLLALGSHDMTILRATFGNPKKIIATTIIPGIGCKSSAEREYLTKIFSLLDYGDITCSFELGGTQRTWFDEEFSAFGNKQTVSIRWPFPWLKNVPARVKCIISKNGGYETSELVSSFEESFEREHLHFVKCLKDDLEPLTNGREAKNDMVVLKKILDKSLPKNILLEK